MRARTIIVVLALTIGCGHEPAAGESVAEVCVADNDGATVSVSGYLVPPVITLGCKESCSMEVTATTQERYGIGVSLPVGQGPRTMAGIQPMKGPAIPGQVERLSPGAFRLTDDQGRDLGPGDVVRITGTLHAVDIGSGKLDCSIKPTSVQGL